MMNSNYLLLINHVTVNTLCYSMIHFVYTHVMVLYNFGKK